MTNGAMNDENDPLPVQTEPWAGQPQKVNTQSMNRRVEMMKSQPVPATVALKDDPPQQVYTRPTIQRQHDHTSLRSPSLHQSIQYQG